MAKIRRVDFYPDEWLAGAFLLKADARGCYITICALIYSHGGPIADDEKDLARLCNVTVEKWRGIRSTLIEKQKIVVEGGRISNRRCSTELEKATNRTEKAKENGAEGGKKSAISRQNAGADCRKNNGLAEADASGAKQANQQPPTNNLINPCSPLAGDSPPDGGPDRTSAISDQPKPAKPKRGEGAGRGTRVPEGDLPEEWAVAANHSRERHELPPLSRRVLKLRWDSFQNYWRGRAGSKGLKADWRATWLNDCIDPRTEKKFPPDVAPRGDQPPKPRPQARDWNLEA